MTPLAVIFDLDGTLIDSVPDLCLAVNATMRDLNKAEHSELSVRTWVGNGAKKLLERALTADFNDQAIDDDLEKALPIFMRHYANNLSTASIIYDGVADTLDALKKQHIKMACVTNKPEKFAHPVLQAFGIDHYFDSIIGAGTLPQLKPDPEPLFLACKQLGSNTQNTLMVGDSISDIKAAKNAHIRSIAVNYGYTQGHDLSKLGADKIISNMRELLDFL